MKIKLHTQGGWYNTILWEMYNGETATVSFVIKPGRMLTIGVKCKNIKHNVGHHSGILYQVISHTKVCKGLATCRWYSPGTPVTYTHKIYRHDATEILLKMALITITITTTVLVTTYYR